MSQTPRKAEAGKAVSAPFTCADTDVRPAACICSRCIVRVSFADKYSANLRDVLQLLTHIATGVHANQPGPDSEVTWTALSQLAELRRRLVEATVRAELASDQHALTARERLEEALEKKAAEAQAALRAML